MIKAITFPPNWGDLAEPWTGAPGVPSNPITGAKATPPATVALLQAADAWLVTAIFGGYAQAGHMVDGNDDAGDYSIHQVHVVWPPASLYSRLHATRCGIDGTKGQSDTLVSDDAAPPAPDIVAASAFGGVEYYLETGTVALSQPKVVSTGTTEIPADPLRAITTTEALAPTVFLHEVRYAAGFCFAPFKRTTDLQTL